MTTMVDDVVATDAAVRVEALGKSYRRSTLRGGRSVALRDCSFELRKGAIAALVGANGAGKTTLLSLLSGVLESDEGAASIDGRVAFVAQEKPVYGHLKPLDVLAICARLNRVWDAGKAERWLTRFDVPTDRPCGKLSGGQRSQVAFAVALASRPDVLLLDEPLADLDPLARREVMAELLCEVDETGMTVVLSTHVITELGGIADHLLLLSGGKLLDSCDIDALLSSHVHYVGPRAQDPPGPGDVVEARHRDKQSQFLVRLPDGADQPTVAPPWTLRPVTLEDYVLAQLAAARKVGLS